MHEIARSSVATRQSAPPFPSSATAVAAMTPRKIIFVNRFFAPDHSATSQILSDLVFHLASGGEAVSVITTRGLYNEDVDLPAFENLSGAHVHRVCKPRFGRGSLLGRAVDYLTIYVRFAMAVWRLAAPGDCVVVKTDPPLLSVALAPVVRFKRARLVNWLQDLYPEIAMELGLRAIRPIATLLIAARNASLRMAACNVVIGEAMRRRVGESGVAAERVRVIANWCDDEAITPRPSAQSELRKDWGLENKFVVGYSGNLGRAHEYETLLGAAEILRDRRDVVFLFIGGGHLSKALRHNVAQRGLSEAFRFLPYQPLSLLPESLAVPDVHWLSMPAPMEGLILPSKFYGVAAAGRPIITVSDPHGELGELVTREACGMAIAPGDAVGLAAAIKALKEDDARLARLGANARAMLERSFRKRTALAHWENLLQDTQR